MRKRKFCVLLNASQTSMNAILETSINGIELSSCYFLLLYETKTRQVGHTLIHTYIVIHSSVKYNGAI